MAQIIMRIVLEPHGRRGRPLGMLLRDALLRDTRYLQLLPPSQLADDGPLPLGVRDDRIPHPLVRPLTRDDQIPRIHTHDLLAGAARVEGQGDGAAGAVRLALAVARVLDVLVAVLGVERDQAETVREELVGQDGGVGLDLDQVDGHRGHLGQDGAAEGVGEGEVDGAELKVDAVGLRLEKQHS